MTSRDKLEALLIEAFTKGRDYQRTYDEHGIARETEEAAEAWKAWRLARLAEHEAWKAWRLARLAEHEAQQ